jgi:hypothetical protein
MHIHGVDGVLVLSMVGTMNTIQVMPTMFYDNYSGVLTMPVVF